MKYEYLDYNYKKQSKLIKNKRISEILLNDRGEPIVRINIWIPQKNEYTFIEDKYNFNLLFDELSKELILYAKETLLKKFNHNVEITHPYSVVMKYIIAFEDEEFISVVLDFFIYTINGRNNTKRMALNFKRSDGKIIISEDILGKRELIENLSINEMNRITRSLIIKAYNESDFYLVPNGLVFFYKQKKDIHSYVVLK